MSDRERCDEFWWFGPLVKYGQRAAMLTAARMRGQGENVSAFRCPWCHEWHVGHPPSMEQLRDLAAAIRARSGNAPEAAGRKLHRREKSRRRAERRAEQRERAAAREAQGRADRMLRKHGDV